MRRQGGARGATSSTVPASGAIGNTGPCEGGAELPSRYPPRGPFTAVYICYSCILLLVAMVLSRLAPAARQDAALRSRGRKGHDFAGRPEIPAGRSIAAGGCGSCVLRSALPPPPLRRASPPRGCAGRSALTPGQRGCAKRGAQPPFPYARRRRAGTAPFPALRSFRSRVLRCPRAAPPVAKRVSMSRL